MTKRIPKRPLVIEDPSPRTVLTLDKPEIHIADRPCLLPVHFLIPPHSHAFQVLTDAKPN